MGNWFQDGCQLAKAAFLSYGALLVAILDFSSVIYMKQTKIGRD